MTAAVGAVGAPRTAPSQGGAHVAPSRPTPALPPGGDLISLLAAAQLDLRDAQASAQKTSAESAAGKRDDSLEKAREAEKAAEAAQRAAAEAASKSSFWKRVGLGASAVALLASVAVTGGSAAPLALGLAGLLLSTTSSKIGQELGSTWGEVAMWTGVACSVAGSCWSVGEVIAKGCAAIASRGALEVGARAVETGASAGATVYDVEKLEQQADAVDRRADALAQRNAGKAAQRDVEQVIELLRVAEQAARKGMQAVLSMSREVQATHELEISSIGRGVRA